MPYYAMPGPVHTLKLKPQSPGVLAGVRVLSISLTPEAFSHRISYPAIYLLPFPLPFTRIKDAMWMYVFVPWLVSRKKGSFTRL